MSRRRRGLLLVGLALLLGSLAAADVRRREAAVDARLAPLVPVLVARADLKAGRAVRLGDVESREVPERWAPVDAAAAPADVAGAVPAVSIPRGAYVTAAALTAGEAGPGAPVRNGERAVEVVAAGPAELIAAGARVDVLVTRESSGTRLALQNVEVLATRPADDVTGARRIAATLRVTLRQAVYLTAAQTFARELRLLPRAAGDGRVSDALSFDGGLR